MKRLNQKYINFVVKKALEEDLDPGGDITTNLISIKNKQTKAKIIAKQDGVIAGLDFCKAAFKLIDKKTSFKANVKDGKTIKKNKVIAEIKAKTKTILIAERTALNFLNHASGIATLTKKYVSKVIPIGFPSKRPNIIPNGTGFDRELILIESRFISALKKANSGNMTNPENV